MECVSKTQEVKKIIVHQKFYDDIIINQQIKQGSWRDLHCEGCTVEEMRDSMQEQYALDDATVDRIEFIFKTKIGGRGNTKDVSISEGELTGEIRTEDSSAIPARALTIDDLTIKVRHRRGDTIKVDCNCDSDYMLGVMDRVGASIRSSYHWIAPADYCYLVMDNAGGHGSDDSIENM